MTTKYQKPNYTDSDIKQFARAFDILIEGAIQNRLIDQHGKLLATEKPIKDNGCQND